MNRRFRISSGRMAISTVMGLALTLPSQVIAGEPAADFFKRLRSAGYHDTAERYLDRLDEYPGIDPDFRSAIDLERAKVAIDAAVAARKPEDRDEHFARAESALETFLEQGDHARVSEARMLLGTIQMGRAEQLMLGEVDDEVRAAARESYLAAAETFDSIIQRLHEQLSEMRGARIDPEQEPEKAALRTRYRNDFLDARRQSGNARYYAAMTFPDPAGDGKQLLEKALEQFAELYDDYGNKYASGATAVMYRGKVQQALGQPEEALDSYLRMLENENDNVDLIRDAKLEAVTGLIEIWLDDDPPKYAPAIDRGQAMVSSMRPKERMLPVAQQLRIQLAKAYLAKAENKDEHSSTEVRRAAANGRRLLNEAKRIPGVHQDDAQELLASVGVEPDESELPTAEDPETIDEAVDGARQILESVRSMEQTLELLRNQDEESADVSEQIAETEAEREQLYATGVLILRRGLALANSDTEQETITRARRFLTHLLYQQGRYREAAVVGGFIARSSPGTEVGLETGLLALNSLQLLISQSGDAVGRRLLPHVERLGMYLASTWPDDPEAAEARGVMVHLALSNDRWDDAERLIGEMPAGREKAHFQRLFGQLTWNRGLEARRDGDDDQADALLEAAMETLKAGLEPLADEQVAPEAMQSALILAKAQLHNQDAQAALETLDHPDYGPLKFIDEVEAPSEAFPADLYSTELQTLVGRMTAPESEDAELLTRAEASMQKLRDSVSGKDAEEKLLRILVRLARDIREQIDSASPAKRQSLIDAFRVFVDRVAESSRDQATLQWVGTTLMEMGESLTEADAPRAEGQAAALISTASKAFQELGGDPDNTSLTIRYQLARSRRLLGEYKRAIDELASILSENANMLDAQIEAALAYEKWAAEIAPQYRGRAYQSALVGARPDASGKNVIWGWGKISQMASRNPKYRDKFFDARYHVALCRFLMGRAMDDPKVVEKAISDITSVEALYPDLGGPEQKQKFDVLLKQIQREAGETPTGLP